MKLGIIYKDNKIINHRSLLKVILNPILRYSGFCICTVMIDNKLYGLKMRKEKRANNIKWLKYQVKHDFILKKRRII